MFVIELKDFGDFDMSYTKEIWVGETKLDKSLIQEGILEDDLRKLLKKNGYKPAKALSIQLSDDVMSSSDNENDWKDKRLRVCSVD